MKFLKMFILLTLIVTITLEAKNIEFTKEEKDYIGLNVINIAMIPNLFPLKTVEHEKLKIISHDILQIIAKKSSLSFNYETKTWISIMNGLPKNILIPLTFLSENGLKTYFKNKKVNSNIFIRKENTEIDILTAKQYFTSSKDLINLSHKDIDLIIAPLLDLQIDMIYNNKHKEILNHIKIDVLKKQNIQFGIKKENLLLISILTKTFDSITQEEWQELNKKWLFDYHKLDKQEKKINIIPVQKKQKKETKKNHRPKSSILKLCVRKNLAPIEFIENGKPKGISIDIIKHINKTLGLNLHYIQVNSFKQALDYIKNGNCDTILTAGNTFGTSNIIKSTAPIYNFDLAIITKKNIPIVTSLSSILNKKIAIKKESIFAKQIKEIYPTTPVLETKDDKESFKMITEKKAYFTLSPHVIASYYLSKYAINDLYISRYTNIPYTINMAVQKDNYHLLNLLSSQLEQIPEEIKENILNKWIKAPIKEAFDYSLITNILLFIMIIISVIVYRQRILKKYNTKLQIKINEEVSKNEFKTKQLIEQSKLAQMGELINMIAHQWRQPLASIAAVTNNLLLKLYLDKEISKKEQIEELSSIIDYSQYMSKTIDDFINLYSKNKIKEQTTLENVIETSLSIIYSSLEKNKIKINKKFMSNTQIHTYPSELNQVVLNLLKNAEDAFLRNETKFPQIWINIYNKQNEIYLEIEDNASGIKQEYLEKIFEPYFSTKQSKEGSGLGLYMSKTIVEDNCKGQLSAQNMKNGIRFTIILPLFK
jgi:signal transduction histidine kinase